MSSYNIFFENSHTNRVQKLMIWLNRSLLRLILRDHTYDAPISILEIGPGKGYFYLATRKFPSIQYAACDRNANFGQIFSDVEFICAETPPLPYEDTDRQFDIVFASYVIEHLRDGVHIADFVESCYRCLKPGGKLVLTCPDAMKQKFELWNMDYTHRYPTTKRNVGMLLNDCGFVIEKLVDINGLLTIPHFESRAIYYTLKLLLWPYSYHIVHFILGWTTSPKHALTNPFYRFHCLTKQQNLLFVSKKRVF